MKKLLTLIAVVAILLVPTAASAAQDDGTVTVVHGVPGLDVDVWVNGDATLEGFTFGTVTDPLTLPAGDYDIEIYAAGTDPEGADPALADTVTLPAGANASIVAHLDADGNPTLAVFVNDIDALDAGEGRVTVRHTAAAPDVDVLAGGDVLFGGVSNGQEGVADVPADTYPVSVVPAGATEPVVFETDLEVPEGTNVIVYAIGSLEDDSFTVAAQTITGLHSAPEGVPTGTGGMAASDGMAPLTVMLGLLGATAVVVGGVRLRRANR